MPVTSLWLHRQNHAGRLLMGVFLLGVIVGVIIGFAGGGIGFGIYLDLLRRREAR